MRLFMKRGALNAVTFLASAVMAGALILFPVIDDREDSTAMATTERKSGVQREVPPIDDVNPVRVETATFALG